MSRWHNISGRPLSSLSWLTIHHEAKLPERRMFLQSIVHGNEKRIVDLGCGPALWLELLEHLLPDECEFVGIDSDSMAISEANRRAKSWTRTTNFISLDLDLEYDQIPEADMYLAFNVLPFLKHPDRLLDALRQKLRVNGRVILRQYDGSLLRFGPMNQRDRFVIESSLHAAVACSSQFHHYGLDDIYKIVANSGYSQKDISFETFERTSPFTESFLRYLENTLDWTSEYLAEEAADRLANWRATTLDTVKVQPSYFVEVDLVAILS